VAFEIIFGQNMATNRTKVSTKT